MAADNTTLNTGSGGETIRSLGDAAGLNWPVGVVAYPSALSPGANTVVVVDPMHGLPVDVVAALPAGTNVIGHVVVDSSGLPTGAATAAKQPALGTAGTPSADVITVQGIASMTALKVDGSAVTQPVQGVEAGSASVPLASNPVPIGGYGGASPPNLQLGDGNSVYAWFTRWGALKVNQDTTNAWTTTVTSGTATNLKAQAEQYVGGTAVSNSNPVPISDAGGSITVDGTFWQATQPISAASLPLPTGAATAAKQPALGTAGTAASDVITIQGIASMTKLLVTPDANSSVNISQVGGSSIAVGHGTAAAAIRVELPTDGTGVVGLAAGSSSVGTVQPGNTPNTTPWLVTDTPATSGGLGFVHVTAAGSNNKTQVKGSAGQVYSIIAINLTATIRYLKIFNNTSAGVTMGTTPADWQIPIPANTSGAGVAINFDKGISHGTGITIAITGAVGLTDNTSISANDVCVTIGYK